MDLLGAFTTAVLPILAMTAVGYLLGRWDDVEVDTLNAVALYAFVPALAFHSLVTTDLTGPTVVKLGVGVVVYALGMMAVAYAAGRAIGAEGGILSALVLSSAFPNAGFYGIPLSAFAFGDTGRTTAVLYLTVQNLLVYTLGVYVASRGAGRSGTGAVGEVFRLPLVYAAAAAVAVRWLGVVPPADGPLMGTVKLMGDASIPLMLAVLGIQLARTRPSALSRTVLPTALKLGVAPVAGAAIALSLAFEDATVARTFVLECATPAAVIPLVLTVEYGETEAADGPSAAEYMSTVIFVTTALSVVALTLLLTLLQGGVVV